MGTVSDLVKEVCKKHNIQFRKMDVRRSENITLGINQNCLKNQKKILVCYMDYDRTAYSLRYANGHTNLQEMFQIIKALIDMDFCIDVCGCNNPDVARELPSDYYDYIFGFGDMFRLAREKNPKAYTIMYMTENPYNISYMREQERIDYFRERTGKVISFERTGKFYNKDDEKLANAIVCLGEKYYFDNQIVRRIYPSAFINEKYIENAHDNRKPQNFMVFGVKGFVHKGNDLLVDVFTRHPEWNLYMCGRDIQRECRKVGIKLPMNIIDCGFVDVASKSFLELVDKCPFILLPSCSEGMSTALLTCMRHGLIPVTMRGTGMDELEEYCEYFEDYRIDVVERKLCELSQKGKYELEVMSDRIYVYANENFTLEKYTENIRIILTGIFDNASRR